MRKSIVSARLGTVARFVCASGLAAVISAGVMLVSGLWVDLSFPSWHIGIAAVAYFTAARINYELQRSWVFEQHSAVRPVRAFGKFLLVNGSIALLVAFASAALMHWPWLGDTSGDAQAVTCLLLAALVCAPISFHLTRNVVVFRPVSHATREGMP
jgi:putative flippase GtrA